MKDDYRLTNIMINYNKLIIDFTDLFEQIDRRDFTITTFNDIFRFFKRYLKITTPLIGTVDDTHEITYGNTKYRVVIPKFTTYVKYMKSLLSTLENPDNYNRVFTEELGKFCHKLMQLIALTNSYTNAPEYK